MSVLSNEPCTAAVENAVVAVCNVSKTYIVRDGRANLPRKSKRVVSLSDVNLVARSGDFIGVIGQNGSGKSTLLNIIAGNEAPTTGTVYAASQPVLLGISAALKPNLSGRDNVRLGLLAMGMTSDAIEEEMPRILDLTNLGDALDRPMDTYSAGMGARLRFAIATAADPNILLIDEALSAGDAAFAKRAQSRMDELLTRAGAVFLVTHATDVINSMCNRAIWIHDSHIIADSTPQEVTESYSKWANLASSSDDLSAQVVIKEVKQAYSKPSIRLID